jgi:hypothetical protein
VRSIVSFQLSGDAKNIAALNLYAESAHAIDEESVELGLIFAAHNTSPGTPCAARSSSSTRWPAAISSVRPRAI